MSNIDELRMQKELLEEIKKLYSDIFSIASNDEKFKKEMGLFRCTINLLGGNSVIYGTYKDEKGKHLILTRISDGSSISFKVEEIEPRNNSENFHPEEMFK